jgi:hypothetical protein
MITDRERLLEFLNHALGDERMEIIAAAWDDQRDRVVIPESPAMPGVPRHKTGDEGFLLVFVRYRIEHPEEKRP